MYSYYYIINIHRLYIKSFGCINLILLQHFVSDVVHMTVYEYSVNSLTMILPVVIGIGN